MGSVEDLRGTSHGAGRLRWRVRYRDPSGRQRAKSFVRKIDAERFLISVEDSKLRGAYVDPAAGRVAFADWAERWYATTSALRASTRADYRVLLDQQVLPAFGDAALSGIDALMIREWMAKLITGGLSAKRTGKAHRILAQVLGSAVEGGRLPRNVALSVKPPKYQRREMAFLTAVQVEILAESIVPPYGILVRFAAYTGLRPCEQVALRLGRVDLVQGTVRIAEAAPEVRGRLEWGGVKSHEARTIRLPKSLAGELVEYLSGRPRQPDALVFTAPRGGPLRESKFVPDRFKPAIAKANERITRTNDDLAHARERDSDRPWRISDPLPASLRYYDLRHTCASLLIAQGASVKAVQAQLGHATASITLDTYGHLFPYELETLAERLEGLRSGALDTLACPEDVPSYLGGCGLTS
jgi:integrase